MASTFSDCLQKHSLAEICVAKRSCSPHSSKQIPKAVISRLAGTAADEGKTLNYRSLTWKCNYRTEIVCRFNRYCERRVEQAKVLPQADKRAFLVRSTPESAGSSPTNVVFTSSESFYGILNAFYRFSRPHTVIGTVIGIISVSLLAVETLEDFSLAFLVGLLKAIIPALFMNIYIVGLNQISDIKIDKINKPYLPLASGEYSVATAIAIIVMSAFMSFVMGLYFSSVSLLCALLTSFVLGTAYSIDLPFLRWKRSAFAAASCILCVRAIVVQIAFYLHMQSYVYMRPVTVTRPLIFATAFMCFFSVVIALFKDIPDIHGDRLYGIRSFSVRLGPERVFWLCIYLLLSAYCISIIVGITTPFIWSKLGMVLGHAVLATNLWQRASVTDLTSKSAITSFYMYIWKLFYAEYLLIPFMR